MAGATPETVRNEPKAGQRALASLRHSVSDWLFVAWKVALVYAVWILASYWIATSTSNVALSQIASVSVWFGVLFFALTTVGWAALATFSVVAELRRA